MIDNQIPYAGCRIPGSRTCCQSSYHRGNAIPQPIIASDAKRIDVCIVSRIDIRAEPRIAWLCDGDGKRLMNTFDEILRESRTFYGLEAHVARATMALRPGPYGPIPEAQTLALEAVDAEPRPLGVVTGGKTAYKEAEPVRLANTSIPRSMLSTLSRPHALPVPESEKRERAPFFIYAFANAVRNI
jgi:hypothetical protein